MENEMVISHSQYLAFGFPGQFVPASGVGVASICAIDLPNTRRPVAGSPLIPQIRIA